MMETITDSVQERINSYDRAELAKKFAPNQMLVLDDFLPRDFVIENYVPEVEACNAHVNRVNVPGFKKSGSVSYHHLEQYAPHLFSFYHSPEFKQFIMDIVGTEVDYCPESDPHAAALYYYTEPGDRIKVHYDKSFYKGKRFTVLLGMVQDSEASKLICYPGASKKNMKKNPITVATHPGTLVIFNGDTLWHEVSPLAENERRVILTMEFLTDTRISAVSKIVSDFKDRYLYFGKSQYQKTEK